ncbi:hypothetical protein ACLKMH_07860 [Psychromonas sp. KJ10-10]|uniref:hypothetical protein n=1 Tax=Psychromonas sp. KJ10-10 TaxID=3391823 RepID=UPI0039B3FBCD
MTTQSTSLNVGITKPFPCSYLNNHQETLIMLIEPEANAQTYYPVLLANGFRRSGNQVYRPHCQDCDACESLRISVNDFIKSRSQKRLINKNSRFTIKIAKTASPQYFDLYQRYINNVHHDGPMYPASQAQYDDFIHSDWNHPFLLKSMTKLSLLQSVLQINY